MYNIFEYGRERNFFNFVRKCWICMCPANTIGLNLKLFKVIKELFKRIVRQFSLKTKRSGYILAYRVVFSFSLTIETKFYKISKQSSFFLLKG